MIWKVQTRLKGHLDPWIQDFFEELALAHEEGGTTRLTGELSDLSKVYGLVLQLRDAGLVPLSLVIEIK